MRRKSAEGAYSITGLGIATSAPNLGAAVSKALTLGSRAQRELAEDEEVRSLYVRRLGEETVARVDITRSLIQVWSFAPSR